MGNVNEEELDKAFRLAAQRIFQFDWTAAQPSSPEGVVRVMTDIY